MSLRNKAFSAVRWTTLGSIIKTLFQVIQVAVLARILSPEDYGLMALVLLVLGFANLFADFGLNSAFLQQRNVSNEQRSSLYWLNVLLSVGLMLIVMALSPLLARIFYDERLTLLISLSATSFFFAALGIQVRMAAEKALQFRPVMIVEVVAALGGLVSSVAAALVGWGVFSLVLGMIATTLGTTVLLWIFVSAGWRPMLRLDLSEVRPFLGFGGALVANNFVNHVKSTIDLFFGGRMLVASQLGLYSMPRELVLKVHSVVNPIITRIAFPLIAEVQHDVSKVRSIYLQTLNMTASTNAPIYIGLAFFASDFVTVLLGSGWDDSIILLQILAIWGALRSIGNPVGSLLLGMGRADLSLKWNLTLLSIVPPAIWYGSHFGPEGMAWAMFVMSIVLFIPAWYVLVRPLCNAGLVEYSIAALRPIFLATMAMVPAFLISNQYESAILRLVIGFLISAPLYLGLSYFANRRWFEAMMELVLKKNKSNSIVSY